MNDYSKAFSMLCRFEGYTSNLKGDKGGYTIWGVSERYFPEDVKNMAEMNSEASRQYALNFYKREFWDKLGCDNLEFPLNIIAFDTSVNCGIHTAKKFLNETKDWKDYLFKRIMYYSILVREKPDKIVFLRGWINRCVSLWIKFKGE